MAILPIKTFPDPILRQKAKTVSVFDQELSELGSDMLDTMYDAPGVGLAANQIGKAIKLLVIDADFSLESTGEGFPPIINNKNPRIFVNPKLIKKSGEISYEEGCLSVPGVNELVKRAENISIHYQDLSGATQTLDAQGFLAVVLQHEMDHLDGHLFLDRLGAAKKSLTVSRYKKGTLRTKSRDRLKVEL